MQPKFVKRLTKEYNAIVNNPNCPFEIELVNDNIQDWIVTFPGPDDTPYEGLKLKLSIKAGVCSFSLLPSFINSLEQLAF